MIFGITEEMVKVNLNVEITFDIVDAKMFICLFVRTFFLDK